MPAVRVLPPRRFEDQRGWFTEVFSTRTFAEQGIADTFVQDNHSLSRPKHTLRGLHFQTPPHAQAKLVRCVRGRILDVVVDLRRGSPTFAHWEGIELSAANGLHLYIPAGFAHGFLTLEDDCEIIYKVSDFYAPQCEGGIRWDDPDIAIDWGLPDGAAPVLSDKDAILPPLKESEIAFDYDGEPLERLTG